MVAFLPYFRLFCDTPCPLQILIFKNIIAANEISTCLKPTLNTASSRVHVQKEKPCFVTFLTIQKYCLICGHLAVLLKIGY